MLLKFTYTKTLLTVAITVSVCTAQNINISGTVTDTGGVAIEGAAVLLEKGGLVDTTGIDGSFTLTGTTGINDGVNGAKPHTLSATINNGFMHLNIAVKSAVEINTYTLQGKVVSSIKKTLGVGAHSMRLPHLGAGVYIYQVQSGSERLLMKDYSISGGISAFTHGSPDPAFTQQAMAYFPINDVIAVTKDDYLNYRVIVTNSDTSGIEIKMIVCAGTVTDIDGNVYQTVRIGDQVWTVENLRTTKYNDGTPISQITDSVTWIYDTLGAYCYYNNTINSDSIMRYGALYNWYTVDTRKLAPTGWHVPSDTEWTILEKYLVLNGYNWDGTTDTTTDNKIAKSMATKTDWDTLSMYEGIPGNDMQTNNSSGFSALPGGYRGNISGLFSDFGDIGYWWSSTEYEVNLTCAHNRDLCYNGSTFVGGGLPMGFGFAVRLVKD